ncbi:MAG: 8-oxo-dGTP pyrophosphatase MutT (NUDIX family) [Planctomycetota bacterium]|jgi:8-oxo-dGTP pyrophosphatase MutT (NUDIX family)
MDGQVHDFVGVFAVLRRDDHYLLVANERRIDGVMQRVWDLPGGRVEAGELLQEALRRELEEETQMTLQGTPEYVFFQEGERIEGGRRKFAWRSFFYVIEAAGVPVASHEVLDVRWMTAVEIESECHAPYQKSFREWLQRGGSSFNSVWRD